MQAMVERVIGIVFGVLFVGLSLFVTVETLTRKLFNVSLQGADELGGYVLAIGATLSFTLALIGRAHIRVDVFHARLPQALRAGLDWLSSVFLAGFSGLLAWLAWYVIEDTRSYQSVSQTPWATPLVYPQAVWLAGLIVFAVVAAVFAVRATLLLLRGRTTELERAFGPRTADEEVAEELEDLDARGVAHVASNA